MNAAIQYTALTRYASRIVRAMAGILLIATSVHAAQATPQKNAGAIEIVVNANRAKLMVEKIAKDYLYIGNKVATRPASAEMKASIKKMKKFQAFFANSINDPKIKNLLEFAGMAHESLMEGLKQPYTTDNALVVLDNAEMLTEGMAHIANLKMKELGDIPFVKAAGANPMIEAIAKYYMAYQAGIHDENTVAIMNETVDNFGKQIEWRVKYPDNTVAMNQIMAKIQRQWKIVQKFYKSIEEGGLPFIVYKTTLAIDKQLMEYNKEFLKIEKAKTKAKK
jgi:hypothetical protein